MTNIRDLSYEHQQAIEAMKSQLLIVLVKRLGGTVSIPVSEIDDTGKNNLTLRVDLATRTYHFEVVDKP